MTDRTEPSWVSRDVPALVFVNCSAGRGRARAYLPRMRSLFQSLDFSAELIESSRALEIVSSACLSFAQGQRVLREMYSSGEFTVLAEFATVPLRCVRCGSMCR